MVGEVSPWGPANRRVDFIETNMPVVWTHTPSWVAPEEVDGRERNFRCGGTKKNCGMIPSTKLRAGIAD
jgi:hypothetical protein